MRLLCYIMETDYTEALTPICVSLTNLAERQLHAKDEEANASKSRHGGQPPCTSWRDWAGGLPRGWDGSPFSRKQPGAQRARPCQRGCPYQNHRRLQSYTLPLAVHSSRPHLPLTLAQTPGQGSWLRLPPSVSSLAPKSPLEGLYIPSESSGTTPTRPSHSPLMTHLLASDPQERDWTDLLTGDPAIQGGCCHGPGALRMDVSTFRR